jgi:hypothetical protein
VIPRGSYDRPVSSTIRAERLRALFHSLPKGPFHLSFTLLLRCRSWSSMFSLRRWTPARLHSTLKLRDSSPGVDKTSAMQAPKMSILNPPARSVMIYPPEWTRITGPSPTSVAASTALRLRAPMDRTVVRQTRSRLHYNSGVSESFYPRFAPRLLPCSLAVTSGITVVFLSSAD